MKIKISIWSVCLFVLVVFRECASTRVFFPAIYGEVVDTKSLKPIGGATITVKPTEGLGVSDYNVTDNDGSFYVFASAEVGRGSVEHGTPCLSFVVEKEGYLKLECRCMDCEDVLIKLPANYIDFDQKMMLDPKMTCIPK